MPPLELFSGFGTQPRGRKSNSLSRTMFQHRLFLEAKPFPESVVWILDDNLVLEGLSHGTGGTVESQGVDYVSAIKRSKTSGGRRGPLSGDGRLARSVAELHPHADLVSQCRPRTAAASNALPVIRRRISQSVCHEVAPFLRLYKTHGSHPKPDDCGV